jgi:transposase
VAWERRVERWRRSGLSARQFAAREGVRASTLTWWRWRLGQEAPSAESSRRGAGIARAFAPTHFVELIATSQAGAERDGSGSFEVKLSSGYRVRIDDGFSGEALTRLLDVLEVRR